jgi:PAS domain S-box-containing protein
MPFKDLALRKRTVPAQWAATAAALLGLVSLSGWAFHLPALVSILPGSVQMKANTAFSVILCGVAELILIERASARLNRIAQALALLAALIGLATLAEYFFGWQLGIDQLLFQDTGGAYSVFHGRMSPFSAAAFVALGIALFTKPYESLSRLSQWSAALVILIGSTSLIGYLWNAQELITDTWLPPVALNTATCLLLLGGGALLAPSRAKSVENPKAELASVEIKILAGFLLAMALLLFGGSFTYRASVEFADSVDWIAHTQEVRTTLANLRGSLTGAQLSQRDYLLSSEPARWEAHVRRVDEVHSKLADLQRLVADNPLQRENLALLRSAVDKRMAEIQSGIIAHDSFGSSAALAVVRVLRLERQGNDVQASFDRMQSLEASLLAKRQAESLRVRHTTLISLLVTLVAAAVLFIALFAAIHLEMRARREAEEALRASDQYNRSIVESSPDCLAILTLDARISQMGPRGLHLMGIDDFASIENTNWLAQWVGEDYPPALEAVEAARNGSAGRFRGSCPMQNGTPKWWDVIVMPIRGADGNAERLLAVARDITEVKRAENELLEANRFLDSLIENLPLMVFVKDARTLRYVRSNRATLSLLGLSKDDVVGKLDGDFLPAEQAGAIRSRDRELLAAADKRVDWEQSISSRELGLRTLHTKKMVISDENGEAKFILGISEDITERNQAEQAIRDLNAELLQNSAQLEATNKELESFSYSVSHDLRAPLRAIDGFALMLEEDCDAMLNDEGRRYLNVIRDNSRRMGALIDDLLQFSRLGRQLVCDHEINVNSLVREVVEEVLATAPAAQIHVDPLPNARGDRSLLRQVWVNLISNAIKYSSKVRQPQIQISGCRVGAEIHYSVKDNGVGFNMAYVGKLFGVFQRLHRADEFGGTGVGLAIVHRVVTRHGGRVWADGEVDRGAEFSFALPNGVNHERL